jgi:polar amino acid transport system permease protein
MAMTVSQRARTSRGIQYGILIGALIVLAFVADWPALQRGFFNPEVAAAQFPEIITLALKNTIWYTILGFIVGLSGGLLLALMKLSSVAPYRWLATLYIEFFRGLPALLVFIAFGYGVPTAFGMRFDTNVVVMLSLGMVAAAYIAETLRAGLQAVPKGQLEAARSLGMPQWRAMLTIIIPQAFRIVLPPLTNEVILLTKDSSLIYLLGLTTAQYELAKFGRDAITQPNAGLTPLVLAGACYLLITVPLGILARRFEARSAQTKR